MIVEIGEESKHNRDSNLIFWRIKLDCYDLSASLGCGLIYIVSPSN